MCCGRGGATREVWVVTLPSGAEIEKHSAVQAQKLVDRNPGATMRKSER